MEYNIDYEIGALLFLLIVIGYFFAKRKYINLQGKIYSFYVLIVFFSLIFDIISVYFIDSANEHLIIINYIMNEIYISCQLVIPAILLLYILSLTDLLKKKALLILSLPMLFGLFMSILNPFNQFYFYFNEQYQYIHGIGHSYLYINAIFYILVSFLMVTNFRKRLGVNLFYTFVIITIILSSTMLYQYYHPTILITGTGEVLILLMLYLAMENPDIYSDSLTAALNEKALREKGTQAYLFIVSMNDFKLINDVFGRTFGNVILKKFAEFLMSETDRQRVFRIYGDIFVIMVEEEKTVYALAAKINDRIKDGWNENNISVRLSLRLGLMETKGYQSNEKLYAMLEYAISEMKQSDSKDLYVVDEVEKEKLVRKSTIQRGIADIITKGHIEMAYQPLYDINGKLFAIEALARMNLVKYGYVSPEEFIKMAEMNGSIYRLGNVIINEILTFIDENKERFNKGLRIGMNLSVIQIMHPMFAKSFIDMLDKHNISYDWIVLEITESEAIYSDPTVMENLQTFKNKGLRLAMDDYGTGYANINNMIDIPFSTIKIDKQVVWNSMHNSKAKIILINTIRMLQQLDFEIVAEGIETEEHLEEMKRLSINLYQGYYYTKPLSRYDLWIELDKMASHEK